MPTVVEKTIGPGGDYTTLALWWADCPASLVTNDIIYRGLVLNTELVISSTFTIGSKTTDPTRYVELTAAAGASFVDNASKATNALRYNASNGAAIRSTGALAINVTQAYTRINRLQIKNSSTNSALYVNVANSWVDKCIIEAGSTNAASRFTFKMMSAAGNPSILSNSVVVNTVNDAAAIIAFFQYQCQVHNNSFVNLGATPLTFGIGTQYAASIFKNNYVGGVVAPEDGVVAATKTTCYSNATATNYSVAALADTFENITLGTHDLRLKSSSALINAGTTDATYAATDILGTARPQGASYDVGAWEFASPDGTAPGATMTGTSSFTGGAATGGGGGGATAPGATVTGTATFTGGAATGGTTPGVFTSLPLKKNNAALHSSLAGITINLYHPTTGALVLQKTGLTSDAAGVVSFSDALLASGVSYAYEPVMPGVLGRRLPVKAAT